MRYDSDEMERQAILAAAARMCDLAARTAPKAKGADNILTMVLTGEEKAALAAKMREIADTGNLAGAVFLSRRGQCGQGAGHRAHRRQARARRAESVRLLWL